MTGTVLCEQFARTVCDDNGVSFEGLTPPIPANRRRCHDIKRRGKLPRHTNSALSIHHGPRMLARYSAQGPGINQRPIGCRLRSAAQPISGLAAQGNSSS